MAAELAEVRARHDAAHGAVAEREQRLEALGHEVSAARAELAGHDQEVAALRDHLEAMEAAQQEALSRLTLELDAARQDVAGARRLVDERDSALRAFQDDAVVVAEEQQALRHALAAELEAVTNARDEALSRLADLERVRDEYASRMPQLEEEVRDSQEARNDALAELAQTRARLDEMSAARAGLEERVAGLSARETEMAAELAGVREAAAAIIAESEALRTISEDLEATRQAQARDLDAAREALTAERSARGHAEAELNDLAARLERERSSATALEAEMAGARQAAAEAVAATQLAEQRLRDERALLEQDLASARAEARQSSDQWESERARLAALVGDLEARQRQLGALGLVGFASTTDLGVVVRANDAFARLCGFETADALLSLEDPLALPFFGSRGDAMRRIVEAQAPAVIEACVRHADGRMVWVLAVARAREHVSDEMAAVDWVAFDTSDRHLRLRQVRQARRLESARDLATAAGQELVSLMTGLVDTTRSVLAQAGTGPARTEARELEAMAGRASALLRQVVAFAQKQARVSQTVDLNVALAHLRPTLRRVLGDEIALDAQRGRDPVLVDLDLRDFDQVVTSALLAVREALPTGGVVTLSTATVDATSLTPEGLRVSPVAQLAVTAVGFGLRDFNVPRAIEESVGQLGGHLRVVAGNGASLRLELYFGLVCTARGSDQARALEFPHPAPDTGEFQAHASAGTDD
jgi:predicted  nucleic acid-binding Zn-ribbon protein